MACPQADGLCERAEKRFCRFEVGRVEPFGKPGVDRPEERQGISGTALIAQQPGKACMVSLGATSAIRQD